MHQGRIPTAWKRANITPLYKGKGVKSLPSSYRPISLTCVACKILERIVVSQIQSYLLDNNLISEEQHGFLPGKSTVSNLLACESTIIDRLNRKQSCDVILLDFARAFDKVQHHLLINKFHKLGISGPAIKWLKDFFANRTQTVIYGGAESSPVKVPTGLIQGSALSPMAFTVFINDMSDNIEKSLIYLFADDTKMVGDADNDEQCDDMQADLDAVIRWSEDNLLPLNTLKSYCLHYGKNNPKRAYYAGGIQIQDVNECTDLGIIRSNTAHYDNHIKSVALKASRVAGMAWKLFATKHRDFQLKIYLSYVRPLLEYASPVWNSSDIGLSNILEKVQRRHTKRLFGPHPPTYNHRLAILKIPSLVNRRKAADVIYAFKILHNLAKTDAKGVGIVPSSSSTRSKGRNLQVRRAINKTVSQSYSFRIGHLWNKLPDGCKCASTLGQFKRVCARHFND
jgi:hypothetical protein